MAYSKVAYGGHTLIDLTQDTAVESDVASGKWFHKADGTRVQGTATGGITPSGTDIITSNGTHDITSYAYVDVSVEAEFHHSVTLSIKFVNDTDKTMRIYYMDRDVNDVSKVIWTSQPINADGAAHTVTFPVVATPIAGGAVRPILYVEGWDGAVMSDATTISGLVPYSVVMDDAQGTGSEMFVFGVISTTATLVIDNNY